MPKVIIVGGGFAGVSAATALAESGFQVELLESRGTLGGRVYSTAPSEHFPAPVDNGPHLFMGCYHETLRLLQRLGVSDPFHWIDPLKLSWLTVEGKNLSLNCSTLPAPFHLALGLLTSNAFSFSEKISLTRALSRFSRKPFRLDPAMDSVSQFLEATHQGPLARERFWVPLCDAVMNVPVEKAPIRGLGEVLHLIFFGNRKDSAMAVASVPLSEIGFPSVAPFLEKYSGSVRFHEGVQAFKMEGDRFELTARSGKTYTGDVLIWAVPPSSLTALWPPGTWNAVDNFTRLGKSPIVSVHVILSRPVVEGHFVGLSGAKFQWVFNRNANWGWKGEGQSVDSPKLSTQPNHVPSLEAPGQAQYLSFTASAADALARLKDPELTALAMKELQDRCPAAQGAEVLHSKVTREMAATFTWNKETDPLRPPCGTPFKNVFLAGDWTDTGLPATIEGACLSGHRAAEKVREVLRGRA